MIPGLVIIFNKSTSEGIFPELLKTAKVIQYTKKMTQTLPKTTDRYHY